MMNDGSACSVAVQMSLRCQQNSHVHTGHRQRASDEFNGLVTPHVSTPVAVPLVDGQYCTQVPTNITVMTPSSVATSRAFRLAPLQQLQGCT
jgi:hypothetical protein